MREQSESASVACRSAKVSDIPQLIALEQVATTAAHWNPEQYERLLANGMVLVAEAAAKICGFVAVQSVTDEWEIENVVVAADCRRRGMGGELIRSVIDFARKQKAARILLEVRESNLAARALYEKTGFTVEGVRPNYYRVPDESAILYSLTLAL